MNENTQANTTLVAGHQKAGINGEKRRISPES